MSADTDTVWAVVLGAILATVGGFAATRLEEFMRRRERERGAALLFGEILSVLELITVLADESRQRGQPYGPLTIRLLRAARRETDVYDRNREALYDLRDATLRAQIHALVVRAGLALEGVFDATEQIDAETLAAFALADHDPAKAAALAGIERLGADRKAAFDFAVEVVGETKPILAALKPLARHTFDAHTAVVRATL